MGDVGLHVVVGDLVGVVVDRVILEGKQERESNLRLVEKKKGRLKRSKNGRTNPKVNQVPYLETFEATPIRSNIKLTIGIHFLLPT